LTRGYRIAKLVRGMSGKIKIRLIGAIAVVTAAFLCGCAASHKTAVKPSGAPVQLQTATKAQLIAEYNRQADAVTSVNAGVTMKLTAGAAYTGFIEQYHEINGFILAEKPTEIRVIGQAPVVGTNIFDMTSDGKTFRIFIPSKNEFVTGPANLERTAAKPIENLRPQHLLDAIFWHAIPAEAPVLLEEAAGTDGAAGRYYVLTVVRVAGAADLADWEIASRIWFDRADLNVSRVEIYEPGGALGTDAQYSHWDTFGAQKYPRGIDLVRPAGNYELQIGIQKLTLDEPIAAEHFVLEQPQGTKLVREGEDGGTTEQAPAGAADGAKEPQP
jgi:outer membrane lipoprotein-sorting protein